MEIFQFENKLVLNLVNDINQLKLTNKKSGVETLFAVQFGRCVINCDQLAEICRYEDTQASFVDVYYLDEENVWQLLTKTKDLEIVGKTEISDGASIYTLYVSQNKRIRIVNEGKVSNKTILKKVSLDSLAFSNNQLQVNVSLENYYYKPVKFYLQVVDRKSNQKIDFISDQIQGRLDGDLDSYFSNVAVTIDLADFYLFIESIWRKEQNVFNHIDFYYRFEVEEFTPSTYFFRLPGKKINSEFSQDVFIPYGTGQMLHLAPYQTKFGNASSKYSVYKKESVDYYLSNEFRQPITEPSKPIILVSEYPDSARDNGLAVFQYLYKKHRREFDTYYVIAENSLDLSKLTCYKNNLLIVGSKKHFDLFKQAQIILHSHSSDYVLPMYTAKLQQILKEKERYFIQHGIIGKRDLSDLYGYKGGQFSDYFVTSSTRETEIIELKHGFPREQILEIGLSRFDKLFSVKNKIRTFVRSYRRKIIFVMFTWRTELNKITDEEMVESDYFKNIVNVLNTDFPKNSQIKFRCHSNFEQYIHLFSSYVTKENVEILTSEGKTIQQQMIASDIMVTDYSSAALDFAIMGKPVVYVKITEEKNILAGSDVFLPGKIVKEIAEVPNVIEQLMTQRDYEWYDTETLDNLYKYRDKQANARLVEHIKQNI